MLHGPELSEAPAHERRRFAGLDVVLDRPRGHVVKGLDRLTGEPYRVVYSADYGYLPGTDGGDGEGLDVFLGPDESSPAVWWVEHLRDDGAFDEYKLFLGFDSLDAVRACYLAHYPGRWLGGAREGLLAHVQSLVGGGPSRGLRDRASRFASRLVRCDLAVGDVHAASAPQPARPEPREEKTMAEISTKTRAALPAGDFALPSQRKYPLEDAAHVRNAAARLEQMKKAGKVSSSEYAEARKRIAAAAKKFGVEIAPADKARPRGRSIHVRADLAPGGALHVRHMADDEVAVRFPPILIPPQPEEP